jgi:hypothetical protein
MELIINFNFLGVLVMKKFIIAAIIAFSFIMASCGDIVDSENNINKIKQNYNSVKSDQEHGVIMPLKVGDKYIYQVTQYWNGGPIELVYNDSIVVKSEVLINGEKWFQVHYPMLNNENDIYLTNTDLGLWFKCDICNKASYLLAHYPLDKSNMPNGKFEFNTLLTDGNLLKDSCQRYINSNNDNNLILNYSNSYSYQHFFELLINKREFINFDCNFVENLGLIRFRLYWIDLKDSNSKPMLNRSYELKKIDTAGERVLQNTFEIDFGDLPLGSQMNKTVNLLNNQSTETISIKNIVINDPSGVFIIQGMFPITLQPNSIFETTVGCRPIKIGNFESIMQIVTDNETFDVKLKCTVRN